MITVFCFDPTHAAHREPGHPERPERLDAVMARLRDSGRLEAMHEVPVAEAPVDALLRVHTERHVESVHALCEADGGRLDPDTYVTPDSDRIARRGAGGLLNVVDAVLDGEADNGFALVRPPGHHARPDAAMGFCLFSNAAVAARHAQAAHGAKRVMVVDWDVHHGNGTQEAFYTDPSVLVVSSQQSPLWPGTGGLAETGEGAGEGFTVNLPYPPGTADALVGLYRAVLPPLAARFLPDLVLVSAGFDAHHLDPLAQTRLSVSAFADLMRLVLEIADEHAGGRLVATLEGGYHPPALAASVDACLAVMADPTAEPDAPFGAVPDGPDLSRLTADVLALHRLG